MLYYILIRMLRSDEKKRSFFLVSKSTDKF